MRSFALTLTAAILLLSACKNETTTKGTDNPSMEQTTSDGGPVRVVREDGSIQVKPNNKQYDLSTMQNKTVASPNDIKNYRAQALSILEKRIEDQPQIPAIIDVGTFYYEFIVKGSEVSKVGDLDNRYIDFASDNTYTYGYNKEVYGGGRYHFDGDQSILLLLDNDVNVKPQEFNTKHAGDSMVLVGRPTYKDNNMQMKLMKVILNQPANQ